MVKNIIDERNNMKKGYKATYDFFCKNHKFEIGQTYELPNKPIPCEYGFHYCVKPIDVLEYYSIQHNFRLLEIEDLSEDTIIEGDKSVTNKIKIVREIPKEEYYSLFGIVDNVLKMLYYDVGCMELKFEYNEQNNCISYKNSNGYWEKREFDERNNCIRFENSNEYWLKRSYDERNNLIYYENSCGYWVKYEFDKNNEKINWESGYKV